MILNKANKRKCTMVLFQLEESLAEYVTEAKKSRNISTTNTQLAPSNSFDIEKAYLDEIFQQALFVSKDTSEHEAFKHLYSMFKHLKLFEVRNALAHPARTFDDNFWFRVATIASDPAIQQLKLTNVVTALISAEEEKLTDVPSDWLQRFTIKLPNNLPTEPEHAITGFIGRNNEMNNVEKILRNERIPVCALVAPGGMGKTALAVELLSKIASNPVNKDWCDAIVFVSMKTEKLTNNGIVKLKAVETSSELRVQLTEELNEMFSLDCETFEDILIQLKEKKILLFLDNMETLLRDNIHIFDELNEELPRNWQVLMTSRIALPHKTIPLEQLKKNSSIDLARRYHNSRSGLRVTEDDFAIICERCFYNPLAIRLTIDLFLIKGISITEAITKAKKDISEFSFDNLISALDKNELNILECVYVEHSSTRQSIHSLLDIDYEDIATSVTHLANTSLLERKITDETERFELATSIRDLMTRSAHNMAVRSDINEKYNQLKGKNRAIDRDQKHNHSKNYHITYIPKNSERSVKILADELFKFLRCKPHQINSLISWKIRDTEQVTSLYDRLQMLKDVCSNDELFYRIEAILFCLLKDYTSAVKSLTQAINICNDSLISRLILGRILMSKSEYEEAHEIYDAVANQLEPQETQDEEYARNVYNGLMLSLIYQQKLGEAIELSKSWKDYTVGRTLLGLLRAMAQKRIAERINVEDDNIAWLKQYVSVVGILDQVFKEEGYSRFSAENALSACHDFCKSAYKVKINECTDKSMTKILCFFDKHSSAIFQSLESEKKAELNGEIKRLINLPFTNNPFHDRTWAIFVEQRDPGKITNEEIQEGGYIICEVKKINRRGGFMFINDSSGAEYYTNVSHYQGSEKNDWYDLKEGSKVAVSITYKNKGSLPLANEIYLIEQ
ncbi:ATP-binding protein [Vibrio parahaemolyticus]|nr:ATP-binding protein [Vibrio parahaemolyticus]